MTLRSFFTLNQAIWEAAKVSGLVIRYRCASRQLRTRSDMETGRAERVSANLKR